MLESISDAIKTMNTTLHSRYQFELIDYVLFFGGSIAFCLIIVMILLYMPMGNDK